MLSMSTLRTSCIVAGLLIAGASQAATFSVSLPAYDGAGVNGATETIGTFNLGLPAGQSVLGATISGFFGNASEPSTAAQEIYADGVKVATCVYGSDCWSNVDSPLPWSYTFTGSELGIFADGQVVLTDKQTDCCVIRLGETTLSGTFGSTPAVPEPSTYALMLAGLGALAWVSRRRAV